MRPARRRLIAVLLFLLVLGGLALSPNGQRLLVRAGLKFAARRLGLPLGVEQVEPSLFGKKLILRKITLGGLLRLDTLEAEWDWSGLLRPAPHLRRLVADGVAVNVAAPLPKTRGGEAPKFTINDLRLSAIRVTGLPGGVAWGEIAAFKGSFAAGLPRGELTGTIHLKAQEYFTRLSPIALNASLGEGRQAPWSVRLRSPEIELDGAGGFSARPWAMEGRVRGRMPLQVLAFGATGTVEMDSRLEISTANGLRVEWEMSSPMIRRAAALHGAALRNLKADGVIDLKGWKIHQARFQLPGGTLGLTGEGIFNPATTTLQLQADGYNVAALVPGLPAAVGLRYSGGFALGVDARALDLTGKGALTLANGAQVLMGGPVELSTVAHTPRLQARLSGAGGNLSLQPEGGHYQLKGELLKPGLELGRLLARGNWPLNLQLEQVEIRGDVDPQRPRFVGDLAGRGQVGGQAAGMKTRLQIGGRDWQAEGLELALGGGTFKGRAGGPLGMTWPALPPDALERKVPPPRMMAVPARASGRGFRLEYPVWRSTAPVFEAAAARRGAPVENDIARATAGLEIEGVMEKMPLAALVPPELAAWQIRGQLSGAIALHDNALRADLRLEGGGVKNLDLPTMQVTATGEQGEWRFRAADAARLYELEGSGPRHFTLRGHLPFDAARFAAAPTADQAPNWQAAGELEVYLARGPDGRLDVNGEWTLPQLRLGAAEFGATTVAVQGDLHKPRVDVRLPKYGLLATGEFDLDTGLYRAQARFAGLPAEVKALTKTILTRLDGMVAATGSLKAPLEMRAGGWIDAADVDWGHARVTLASAILLPGAGKTEWPLRARSASGVGDGRLVIDYQRGVALTLATLGDASFVTQMLDDLYIEGKGMGNLRLRFPYSGPAVMAGDWSVSEAAFGKSGLPIALSGGSGRVRLAGDHLYLEELAFVTEGGSASGDARLDFGAHGVDLAELKLRAESTRLSFIPGLTASADADLVLTYRWDQGWLVRGKATILEGRYTPVTALTSASGGGLLTPISVDHAKASSQVSLDLELISRGGLSIASRLFKIGVEGEMRLLGPSEAPSGSGRLEGLPGGIIRFRDRQYSITRMTLDFTGKEVAAAQLDLEGVTQLSGYQIYLMGTGSMQNPVISFRSDPAMDLQNIVTLLLTGKTQDQLSEQGIEPSNQLIALYTLDQAVAFSEEAGVGKLVEYISLTPTLNDSGSFSAPSLTMGRNFGESLSSLVRVDLGGGNYSAEAEYSLSRKWRAGVGTSSLAGGIGGDVRYLTPFDPDPALRPAQAAAGVLPLGGVQLLGLDAKAPAARKLLGRLKIGKPYARPRALKATDRLRRDLRRDGYLLARVSFSEKIVDAGVQVTVNVIAGPLVELRVTEAERPRRDLERRLKRLDNDIPFRPEFRARLRHELDTALAEEGLAAPVIIETESSSEATAVSALESASAAHWRLAFAFPAAPRYKVNRLGKKDWPRPPEGAPAARDYFPSLHFGLRFSPWPRLRSRYNTLLLQQEKEHYLAALNSAGYAGATLTIDPRLADNQATVGLLLNPGPRAHLTAVNFSSPPPLEPERLPIRPGQPLTGPGLVESRRLMLDGWYKAGYRDAQVRWQTQIEADGAARVEFELQPGAAAVTGAIDVTGMRHTRASVVNSRLEIATGGPLDPRDLDASRTALYRSGVFSTVNVTAGPPAAASPTAPGEPGVVPVRVELRERPRFEFGGALGYDSEEKLRASTQLSYNNFLGRARRLSLSLKHSALERRADLTYRDPSIFGLGIEFTGTGRYQFLITDSYDLWRRGIDLRATRALSEHVSLQGFAQLIAVHFKTIRVALSYTEQRRYSVPSVGATLVYNGRDEALNPRRGSLLSFGWQYAAPFFAKDGPRFTKLTLTAFHYRPLAGATWAQGLRAGYLSNHRSTPVPISELFFAGGDGTVRGFVRDRLGPLDPVTPGNPPLGGTGLLVLNQELRFPLGAQRKVNFSLFVDGGNIWAEGLLSSGLRFSYGAGFFYLSPLGPLRFEYGRPFSPKPEEPRGVFHFAIGRAF